MDYNEIWQELKDKLSKAKPMITEVRKGYLSNDLEYHRLSGKLEGVNLALDYMNRLEKLID